MNQHNPEWSNLLNFKDEQIHDLRALGYTYITQGLYPTSREIFEALTILAKDNLYDIETLGAIYLEEGKSEQALALFDQALNAGSKSEKTLLNRAKALFGKGYRNMGIQQAEQLLKSKDTAISSKAAALLSRYI